MKNTTSFARTGYIMWLSLSVITFITFAIAILTPPLSGPLCPADCFQYPFLDIASRFPRDYYWMYTAILLYIVYIACLVVLHQSTRKSKKFLSHTALLFGFAGSLILITDYFLQITVIQPALLNNETDGISMLTQYNPHGVFIALEELGYLLISITFLLYALLFKGKGLNRAVKIVFLTGFILNLLALLLTCLAYGIHREYYYEIAAISIVWLVFIPNGAMIALLFKRLTRKP